MSRTAIAFVFLLSLSLLPIPGNQGEGDIQDSEDGLVSDLPQPENDVVPLENLGIEWRKSEVFTTMVDRIDTDGRGNVFSLSSNISPVQKFDTEGRVSLTEKLINHAKIKNNILFVGLGKTFQLWEPTIFEKFRNEARKKAYKNRENLKWENKNKKWEEV